ncbi:IS5 family transposase [Streptomyces sp. CL12-4]|nr:IS5 family transposase [Streptomyces sp. CL12-4]
MKPRLRATPGSTADAPPRAAGARSPATRAAARRERPGLLPGGRRRLPHPGAEGGSKTGRSPVDRGRTGSKHHLITDGTGIPLAATLTGGNRNDVTQLIPLLQAVPPVRGKRGRPRRRPDVVLGDRGYDHDKYRRLVRDLGVKPLIVRRGTEHGSGLSTQRRVVERAFAHLHWFRRLRIRWEIRDDIHEGFLTLACALICWRRLKSLR